MGLQINVQATGNRSEGRSIAGIPAGDVFLGEIEGETTDDAPGTFYLKLVEGYVAFGYKPSSFGPLSEFRPSYIGGDLAHPKLVRNYRSVKATLNVGE